jgi:ABC-type multidrug transport system fused ATPase/permease subunit
MFEPVSCRCAVKNIRETFPFIWQSGTEATPKHDASDPYFFPETVRKSLDTDANFADDDIQARLTKVGLDNKIQELRGLDAHLVLSAFSASQLQLLSLARAMLQPKGILLFDEATTE